MVLVTAAKRPVVMETCAASGRRLDPRENEPVWNIIQLE